MTEMYDRGLKVRREVLGADYVDKQIASADDFNRPMQNLVTEYCWGAIWNRPGLDRRTRSMLNLAMLSALNRHHEFKAHRSEEHTSELQSRLHLVCRLLLEK